LWLYCISLVLCAYLFSVFEARAFTESLYWTCVTALTIGYGDIAPVTQEGRLTAMLFAHFWVFGIAPLVIANVIAVAIEDRDAFTNEEQEEIKAMLRTLANERREAAPKPARDTHTSGDQVSVDVALLERLVGSHYKKQHQFMVDKDTLRAILDEHKQEGLENA
jgi:hypothetical protein